MLANRDIAPDAVLRIDDVISPNELVEWQERYRKIAGFAADDLKVSPALV